MLWSPQKYLFYVEQYYRVPLWYIDAVVVEVETFSLLFRLALAILCTISQIRQVSQHQVFLVVVDETYLNNLVLL